MAFLMLNAVHKTLLLIIALLLSIIFYCLTWYDDCNILMTDDCHSILNFIVSNFVIALIFLGFHKMPVVLVITVSDFTSV